MCSPRLISPSTLRHIRAALVDLAEVGRCQGPAKVVAKVQLVVFPRSRAENLPPAKVAKVWECIHRELGECFWAFSYYYLLFLLMKAIYYLATLAGAPSPLKTLGKLQPRSPWQTLVFLGRNDPGAALGAETAHPSGLATPAPCALGRGRCMKRARRRLCGAWRIDRAWERQEVRRPAHKPDTAGSYRGRRCPRPALSKNLIENS